MDLSASRARANRRDAPFFRDALLLLISVASLGGVGIRTHPQASSYPSAPRTVISIEPGAV
jgi:hypothetical protein